MGLVVCDEASCDTDGDAGDIGALRFCWGELGFGVVDMGCI